MKKVFLSLTLLVLIWGGVKFYSEFFKEKNTNCSENLELRLSGIKKASRTSCAENYSEAYVAKTLFYDTALNGEHWLSLAVELEDGALNAMRASISEPSQHWSRIDENLSKDSTLREIMRGFYLSIGLDPRYFPNVWTEDEDFFYIWCSECLHGVCINKKTFLFTDWTLGRPIVFLGEKQPIPNPLFHRK